MKLLKKMALLFLVIILVAGGCIFYAFQIEPYRLVIHNYHLLEEKEEVLPVKILQFSDVHMKEDFAVDDFTEIVDSINRENPDIVVFTGDLYDNYAKFHEDEKVIDLLSSITARYAKIAIWGNRDYGGGGVRSYESIMEQSGFTLLKNKSKYVTVENNKTILFTGLDDSLLGNPQISVPDQEGDYNILLTHEPDTAQKYLKFNYELILSGHSHGGQIDIPFLPWINKRAVLATSMSAEYTKGMYALQAGKFLYVNTGMGTTHVSARFGVVPEIAVFDLYL